MTNKKNPLILTIDNGTQSIRALLFDFQGHLIEKAKIDITPYYSDNPGWAEQNPDYYWQSLVKACIALWSKTQIDKSQIKAVSLTSQRGTYVCVDKSGQAIRPAITWLDQRRASIDKPLGYGWDCLIKCVGKTRAIKHFRTHCYSQWLAQHQPDIWQNTHKFLLLSGWQLFKLTGKFKDSTAAQVGYIPFSYRSKEWSHRWNWKWQATGIKSDQLPELVRPGDLIGHITPTACEQTGIPQGLPVIASAADKACEVLGSGVITPHTGCLSYGTTATFNTVHYRYVEPRFLMPPWPSAVPDAWNAEFMIYRGYWMVSWFKKQFGHHEVHHAKKQGIMPEALLECLIHEAPPGSMGLMLQPYWSPGLDNHEAKGGIIGFGDIHTRAHVYRAIIEGLAYALREGKESLEKRTGKMITSLIASGGGSQSDGVLQLTADVFNLPVKRPHTHETSGLGAAINAAVGVNVYPDYSTAVKKMVRITETFEPKPDNVMLYEQLYRDVYKKMYKQLKPLYKKIRTITRYPE